MLNWDKDYGREGWRADPATDRQCAKLLELGVEPSPKITKGEASELISKKLKPDYERLEILRFFSIEISEEMTEYDANMLLSNLALDPSNIQRYLGRSATQEQRQIFSFVIGHPPTQLSFVEAERAIADLWQLPEKANLLKKYYELEDEKQERIEMINSCREYINNLSNENLAPIKWVNKFKMDAAVVSLERTGRSLDEVLDDTESVIRQLLVLHPDLNRGDELRGLGHRTPTADQQNTSSTIGQIIAALLTLLLLAGLLLWRWLK